jgi:DNA-binding MarR family transcriptional regulator
LQVEHHSAVEMIDRLQRRRLVTRSRDNSDKRRVLVQLTPRGDALLSELALSHRDELRSAAPALVEALNELMAGHRRPRRRSNGRPMP